MSDQHNIRLREAVPEEQPDLLEKIKQMAQNLIDVSTSAAGKFVKGKGEQELAKAAEIKAKVIMHLGGLELERQKFVAERDAASAQSSQRQYELQTERLKAVVDSLLTLKQLGADVRLEVVADRLIAAMPTLEAADVENVPMYRGGDDP